MRRPLTAALVAALVVAGCTGDDGAAPAPSPSAAVTAAPTPVAPPRPDAGDVELAAVPAASRGWASSLGLPVVGAIRTSTPLARLAGVPLDERVATCASVATELDGIGGPGLLTALAVTADAETATLLTADIRAKADLLAVCDTDGEQVDALIGEVGATHAVAVAWLGALAGTS